MRDKFLIGSKVLARSFELVVSYFLCSAGLISTAWSQSVQEHHIVAGRVQIPTVTEAVKVAEPNQILLQSGWQRVTSVVASWAYYNGDGFLERPFNEKDDILPVSYESGGGAYVNVTPRRLGKVQLTLFVSFADGGVERKMIDLQVGQSGRPPERVVIGLPGIGYQTDTPVLSLDLSDAYRTEHIYPAAIYKSVTSPVPLNAADVSFKFIASTGTEAAAEIDPSTAIVTARHVGQALLETSFGGVTTLTCIDVMQHIGGGTRSRCEELLPPGRHLPPSAGELDPTPPPVIKVR